LPIQRNVLLGRRLGRSRDGMYLGLRRLARACEVVFERSVLGQRRLEALDDLAPLCEAVVLDKRAHPTQQATKSARTHAQARPGRESDGTWRAEAAARDARGGFTLSDRKSLAYACSMSSVFSSAESLTCVRSLSAARRARSSAMRSRRSSSSAATRSRPSCSDCCSCVRRLPCHMLKALTVSKG